MSNNATLQATMTLEISQLQAQLAKSSAEVAKFKAKLKAEGSGLGNSLFGGLHKQFGDLLPAMGVAAAVGGLKSITNSMDDLADTALRLNESTEMIQRVSHASEILAGVNAEGLTKSFLKLEKSLGDLDNEAATNALADLGITAEKLAAAPLDEKILLMSEAFQKARATGTGYNDILDLLGKSAGDLIPMFMASRETITGLFDDAHIVPDEEVQRLAALNDQIDGFVAKLKGWGTEIVAGIVGWTQAIGEGFGSGLAISIEGFSALLDTGSFEKAQEHVHAIMDMRQEIRDQEAMDKLQGGGSNARTPAAGARADTAAEKAAAKEAQKEADKQAKLEEAQNKRIGDKYIEVEKLKREAAEERLPIEGRIAALQERMAAAKELEAKAGADQDVELKLDAEKQQLEIQRELSRLAVEQADSNRDAAEECAKIAEEGRKAAVEAAKVTAERKKQVAQHQANRENVMLDMQVLRLRARGKDKQADKLERDQRIAKEAARLVKEENATQEQALKLANERVSLEDKLQARRDGKPSHIGGVKEKHYMNDADGASGLEEFHRNQKKRPLRPGEKPPPGYKQGDLVPDTSDSLSGRGGRGGHMMGGDGGSLADRAARANSQQDSRENTDTSMQTTVEKILATLLGA